MSSPTITQYVNRAIFFGTLAVIGVVAARWRTVSNFLDHTVPWYIINTIGLSKVDSSPTIDASQRTVTFHQNGTVITATECNLPSEGEKIGICTSQGSRIEGCWIEQHSPGEYRILKENAVGAAMMSALETHIISRIARIIIVALVCLLVVMMLWCGPLAGAQCFGSMVLWPVRAAVKGLSTLC